MFAPWTCQVLGLAELRIIYTSQSKTLDTQSLSKKVKFSSLHRLNMTEYLGKKPIPLTSKVPTCPFPIHCLRSLHACVGASGANATSTVLRHGTPKFPLPGRWEKMETKDAAGEQLVVKQNAS